MTLRRYRLLKAQWAHLPPVALLVSRYLGYKPPKAASTVPQGPKGAQVEGEQWEKILQQIRAGGGKHIG